MIYLASPHSHESAYIRHVRYQAVCKAAAYWTVKGKHIFSPIAHAHPIALEMHKMGLDHSKLTWSYWEAYDRHMLSHCEELWILSLRGWETSVGVTAERKIAAELKKPIFLVLLHDDETYTLRKQEYDSTPRTGN